MSVAGKVFSRNINHNVLKIIICKHKNCGTNHSKSLTESPRSTPRIEGRDQICRTASRSQVIGLLLKYRILVRVQRTEEDIAGIVFLASSAG